MNNESQKLTRQQNKKKKKKSIKKKRSAGTIILNVFLGFVLIGCIAFLSGVGLFWYYAKSAPSLDETRLESPNSSKFFALNGEEFQSIGAEKRETITANEIPPLLEDAIVSVEDRRFYKHIGIDPIRIVGSALSNVTTGGMQGGSTLTQQLIKLSFFSTDASDQTIKRKAQEAWLAVQLEKEKSKQEILTYYINKVYMSNGLYGMQTASKAFFGKGLDELTLAQTALIAGLPNAPSYFDPYANPENAKNRRDIVLYTMKENDKITEQEYQEAIATPIDDGLIKLRPGNENWKYFDNYLTEVIAEVKRKTGKDVYTDGLEVYTNIDIQAQKQLYDIVNSDQYVAYPDDEMQVAATLIDVNTGKVTAQIGGRKIPEGTMLGQNLATNVRRDFGSTVKPLMDYAPAFEYLKYSTGKYIVDEPYKYVGTNLSVTNWDNQYWGSMTLRRALVESRNVPAAKLFWDVGADKVNEFINKLGIEYAELQQFNAISSNISTEDGTKYGISSLKLAAAYAAFANGGTYYEPQYVNKIVFQDGSEETDAFNVTGEKAMEETTAYMVTDILKGVITSGTGTNASIRGLYQAGKTGTSNYTDEELSKINSPYSISPDSTFAGYTPNYSLAVWTGYDEKLTPITSEYARVASDVYRELMQYVSASVPNIDWEMPTGLTRVGIELYLEGTKIEQPAVSKPKESSKKASEESKSSESSAEPSTTTSTPPVETVPSETVEIPPVQSTPVENGDGNNEQTPQTPNTTPTAPTPAPTPTP
ncbi:PBP1A family penicillin-binding protein [Enterococcus lemanii]|uniref:PBP1A family penicillin-binding protein n=1 Tax=Enterococcus lemanii TaxID=1159752 RepID=A0ABV9MX95_9ENTE|nr:PBP1A family penicillin-binding protein [Enterococcus lemanii]MBM7709189.1 penicillin-binding protein 1A [Enterococcus lemanii]